MPSRQISDLCEEMQGKALLFLTDCNYDPVFKEAGARVFLTCTFRNGLEQNEEYAKGRTAPGVPCYCGGFLNRIGTCQKHPYGLSVTKAQAGQSPHGCLDKDGNPASKAYDFAIRLQEGSLDWNAKDPLWRRAIAIGQGLGLESGGSWGDNPHFQLPRWKES